MVSPRPALVLFLASAWVGLSACGSATPEVDDAAVSADKLADAPVATAAPGDAADADGGTTDRGGAAGGEAAAEPGASDLELSDVALAAGGDVFEVALSAVAGQAVTARVSGVSLGSVWLDLLGPDGVVLASSAEAPLPERSSLQAAVVDLEGRMLRVSSAEGSPALTFDLTVKVTGEAADAGDEADAPAPVGAGTGDAAGGAADGAAGAGGTPSAPKRIAFQAGAAGGSIKGEMAAAGETQRYLVAGGEGQVLSLTLTADPADAIDMMVFTPAGGPLRPLLPGDDLGPQRFPLPEAGDYLITLSAAAPADWTLDLVLEDEEPSGAAAGVPAGAPPTRVMFGPGNRSTRLQGQVDGMAPQRYVLRGGAGDTLALNMESEAGARPQVFVEDSHGRVLASGLTAQAMTVPLPASEDYWVTVLVTPQSDAVAYAMTIGLQ
jgi:hypothetical protein